MYPSLVTSFNQCNNPSSSNCQSLRSFHGLLVTCQNFCYGSERRGTSLSHAPNRGCSESSASARDGQLIDLLCATESFPSHGRVKNEILCPWGTHAHFRTSTSEKTGGISLSDPHGTVLLILLGCPPTWGRIYLYGKTTVNRFHNLVWSYLYSGSIVAGSRLPLLHWNLPQRNLSSCEDSQRHSIPHKKHSAGGPHDQRTGRRV